MTVDGLVGLRAVRTETEINGFDRVTEGGETILRPVSRSKSYTDFLPNVSARLRLTPKLQLRLAFTETRTRPGFGDLNPSPTITNGNRSWSEQKRLSVASPGANPPSSPTLIGAPPRDRQSGVQGKGGSVSVT